ncbi:MAG: PAS domain S-box protein [Myxococcales bacterium]|nr:MAG: PAS domain S-box protein [Myxococcales bacterium]
MPQPANRAQRMPDRKRYARVASPGGLEPTALSRKQENERFRKLAERVRLIPWEADACTWRFTYVGPQAADILGYPPQNWYDPSFWVEHIHPDDRIWTIDFCELHSAVDDDYEFEYRMLAADGRIVWLHDIVNVVRDSSGPQLLRGMMIDITERKQAEEAQRFLVHELDHRVKNTLALVQSIADQTLISASTLGEFGRDFRDRISALSLMHALIRKHSIDGLSFATLVSIAVSPFHRDGNQLVADGETVRISVHAVRTVGMVLHELATNAAKYGALSVAGGQVKIGWRLAEDDADRWLRVIWDETGGPTVGKPTRRGFGTTLIEQSVPYELDGEVQLEFAPAGVHCELAFPIREQPAGF